MKIFSYILTILFFPLHGFASDSWKEVTIPTVQELNVKIQHIDAAVYECVTLLPVDVFSNEKIKFKMTFFVFSGENVAGFFSSLVVVSECLDRLPDDSVAYAVLACPSIRENDPSLLVLHISKDKVILDENGAKFYLDDAIVKFLAK